MAAVRKRTTTGQRARHVGHGTAFSNSTDRDGNRPAAGNTRRYAIPLVDSWSTGWKCRQHTNTLTHTQAHEERRGARVGGSGQWAVGRHAQVDMPDCTTTDTCIGKHATARDGLGASSSPDVGKTMAAFGSARAPRRPTHGTAGTEHPDKWFSKIQTGDQPRDSFGECLARDVVNGTAASEARAWPRGTHARGEGKTQHSVVTSVVVRRRRSHWQPKHAYFELHNDHAA